ncbi:Polyamine aminopropyltransferase [Zalerion maritima]|uniref:Polyamine aminopropyltransferase n=1 Tax=Zalerion maritima TaxID=339359 RepID=A0AAD5WWZ8_9PEZI|nr:Polyamine aminopropyltransferase [Zalerion maritima]
MMAPKKNAKSPPKSETNKDGPTASFTQENFEKELRSLSEKAKNRPSFNRKKIGQQAAMHLKSISLLLFIGIYSNVSQLALSPIYGSIPSAINHSKVVMVACFVGWSVNLLLQRVLPFKPIKLLPIIAWYIPVVQYAVGFFTKKLTTDWGPVLTEMLTLFPIMTVSVAIVATWLADADFSLLPPWLADALPGFGSYGFFKLVEDISAKALPMYVGGNLFLTRMGMEIWLALTYTVIAPSKLLLLALPAVIHTALFNTHVMTGMSMSSLQGKYEAEGWKVIDRGESLTGYLSVLENTQVGFRALRCDHSLLGGEWVKFPVDKVAEPIYGVFAMLEAVRLVETEEPIKDLEATALVIGLGIGTTPAALVMHGIDTTVVEIDPLVHAFANQYFHLPANHTPIVDDAVKFARDRAAIAITDAWKYDYIVHDVFTGGAEPVSLFTLEFIQDLATLLKEDGVIAINYAGDFLLPSPALVVRTIKTVFPTCRIFRENPRESDEELEAHGRGDFTNMVIFCTKSTERGLKFRAMVPEDTLKSKARQAYLMPQNEVTVEDIYGVEGDDGAIVRKNETGRLSVWHEQSAVGHWKVMRTVIPPIIWELW